MSETVFVYMNLNRYSVVVSGPYGGPIEIPRNRAVKGDFYARFAQPSGPLSMVAESQVAPSAILAQFEVSARTEQQAEVWAKQKKETDPLLVKAVPPSVAAPVAPPVVVEAPVAEIETAEPTILQEEPVEVTAVVVENEPAVEVVEEKTEPTPKKKRKK